MAALVDWLADRAALVAGVTLAVGALGACLFAWRSVRLPWTHAAAATFRDVAVLAAVAPVLALASAPGPAPAQDRLNLVPFRDLLVAVAERGHSGPAAADVLANAAVFVPIGVALSARFPRLGVRRIALIAAATSVAIELGQVAFASGRATDATDVVTNVLGAAAGHGLWHVASWLTRQTRVS